MRRTKPYQPLLLRVLHSFNALIAVLAIITSFLVYNTYDGRIDKSLAMKKRNTLLIVVEILVMSGIVTAFIAPLIFTSDKPAQVSSFRL